MMETKLWIVALCALLLINLGSADHDGDHATASSSASQSGLGGVMASEAPATASVPSSSLGPITHAAAAPSLDDTNPSLSKNTTTTEVETNSVTPEPVKVNGTDIVSPSESPASGNNENLTVLSTQQPANPSPGNPTPTPDTPPVSTTTTTSTTHTTHTTTVNTSTTAPTTTTHAEHPLPDSVTPSKESSHNNTSTPVPTPEPPKPEPTTSVIAQSSTGSSSETPKSDSTTKSPLNTSQPDRHPETSTKAQLKSTINPPSSPTAQARSHPQTPSALNVGDDPTMVHESPTLDPLLAGLVSAFIITAVIITLLLFLKLRRRDNRPEFRRLQDLPMDDMMEDTPLSMYSY